MSEVQALPHQRQRRERMEAGERAELWNRRLDIAERLRYLGTETADPEAGYALPLIRKLPSWDPEPAETLTFNSQGPCPMCGREIAAGVKLSVAPFCCACRQGVLAC